MERREAPAFSRESAATEDWCAAWRSIPSIWFEGVRKACARERADDGVPGAAKKQGDDAWLFDN